MALEFIGTILGGFVLFFEFVSALIIIYGGLKAVSKILLAGIFKKPQDYKVVRKEFTDNILFGLELLIIADLIETLRKPFLQELLLVGGIVVIRTVLSYFLSKEVEEGSLTVSKDKLEG
jgi:uncharacterized membrane protein